MALQRAQNLVRLGVPDLHSWVGCRLVAAGRRDEPAVGAHGDRRVGVRIMSDLKEYFLSGHVPNLDGGIGSAGRNHVLAVLGEGHSRYRSRPPLEGSDLLSRGRVVNA